jgi:PAS domain S-box-containing protein
MEESVRVLVVDDDELDRMAVRRSIKAARLAASVEESQTSADALALMQQQHFDCVFLDYRLPGVDGLEVLRAVRAAGIKTPIVMLTGQGDEQLAVEIMKAGATDYLAKGRMSPEMLAASLRNAIRISRAEAQAAAADQQRAQALSALLESEERFRAMADSAPVLLWIADTDGRCIFFNQAWLSFTGRTMEQELGYGWAEGIHPDDYARVMEIDRQAVATRQQFEMEYRLRRHDGAYRWLVDVGTPRLAPDGTFLGFIGSCIDITERKRIEDEQRFLAEASAALSSSLDYETRLIDLAHLAVPFLADWCVVDSLDEEGHPHRLVIRATDPALEAHEHELQRRFPLDTLASFGAPAVLRTGQAELHPDLPDELIEASAHSPEHLEMLRRTGLRSLLSAPLLVRGRILGAITLGITTSGRRYGHSDLALAEQLAHRAAVAADNARLYQEAQAAVHARDAFLSIAAHELKTPLTSLLGYTDLLRRRAERDGLSERDARALAVISNQAGRLNRMITSLLDLSRIQTGQLSIERGAVDLCALLERVVNEVQPTLSEHSLSLSLAEQPLVVEGDELRLEQVFQNLIQNAVKYSPEGGAVQVQVQRHESQARVAVTDQGIGIPADSLPRLFSRFYRAANASSQNISGMGVGLFVVREIISLHGGSVEVQSREGQGSTFTVSLPLKTEE